MNKLVVLMLLGIFTITLSCQTGDQTAPFTKLPADKQLTEIQNNLVTVKESLFNDGKYSCCTMPRCNWCLLREKGSCVCMKNVISNEAVCPECFANWKQGKGNVSGINPENVKMSIVHKHNQGEIEPHHGDNDEHEHSLGEHKQHDNKDELPKGDPHPEEDVHKHADEHQH